MKTDQPTASDLFRQWVTIAAIIGAFGVNVLSNLFPLNGQNIGEIANTVFAKMQILPASYAFAIWGLIYLGLFAFGVYQLLPSQRENVDLRRVDYLLVLACLAQSLWVYLFLDRFFGWSIFAMLGILISLILIHLRLGIGRPVAREQKWFVHVPFSIYLGWITVATVVNVACALYAAGWNGWGIASEIWTVLLILASGAIAALMTVQRGDVAFPLVIVWALVAIAVRQASIPLIVIAAIGVAIGLIGLLVITKRKRTA